MATDTSSLAQADQAAQAQSDTQAVDATTVTCPPPPQAPNKVIEVTVVGEDGKGLDGIELVITRDDGQALIGKTSPDGRFLFKGLPPGTYQLSLPELDEEAWQVKTTVDLSEADANCTLLATWQPAPEASPASEQTHVIKQGECIGKIAERYGFFPATIWEHDANAALKELRHDNMYILLANDEVVIPEKRQKTEAAEAGKHLTIERKGVPEFLHIRFLNDDESPRAGVPYLLSLTTGRGDAEAEISGKTDAQGFVNQAVSPDITQATIVLNPGPQAETYAFNIGYTDPIDTVSGWQGRLKCLGYDCGEEGNGPDGKTEMAIREFQRARQLEETGSMDEATRQALLSAVLS